jgi:hypothetical protein
MVYRPAGTQLFEFVTVASLRAGQLLRGSVPRVAGGSRATITAQREVAGGAVRADARAAHAAAIAVKNVEFDRVRRSNDSGKDIPR